MTITEALVGARADMERRCSSTIFHAYDSHARAFSELWGARDVTDLDHLEIEDWIAQRRRQVKDSTISHQLSFLRTVYNWVCEQLRGVINPAMMVRTKLKGLKRNRWLSASEEDRLCSTYCKKVKDGELEFSKARFAILTGCRRLEQMMLRPSDIVPNPDDPEEPGTLTINHGKCGQRIIAIHPEAIEIALIWAEISRAEKSPWIFWPEEPSEDPLVRCKHGMRYHRNTWLSVTKAAGLADLQWRDLRRTFACRMIHAGVPVFDVQQLLGHANPTQTMTYCHAHHRQLCAAVMKLY